MMDLENQKNPIRECVCFEGARSVVDAEFIFGVPTPSLQVSSNHRDSATSTAAHRLDSYDDENKALTEQASKRRKVSDVLNYNTVSQNDTIFD